jgi:hypothetical protein
MSQLSPSTCTLASSPVHVAVDDPDPGDTGNDDVVREENRGQEKSDDDDSTSPSNKEQSDDASIATALITELIDLCTRTPRDHLQEQYSPDPLNQNHAPALDTHDDIQYLNGFPAWRPFALCSSVIENVEYRVLICPIFNGRLAVPMLQTKKSDWKTVESPDTLWDAFELRFSDYCGEAILSYRIRQFLRIWYNIIRLFFVRRTSSLNDMLGIWVLWRTILRCLCYYLFMIRNYCSSENSPVVDEYLFVSGWLTILGTSLDAKINVKNTDSALWERTLNAIGY